MKKPREQKTEKAICSSSLGEVVSVGHYIPVPFIILTAPLKYADRMH